MSAASYRQRGFTLIETIMVITITGILAGMVAVFIKPAIDSYFDQARRAELTDIADTALRRMTRDLRLAVPNTVRVSADGSSLEFLLARTGGRYRYDTAADESCFTSAAGCTGITTRGSVVGHAGAPVICTGAGAPAGCVGAYRVVIYNQCNNDPANCPACSAANPSAYCGNNTSAISATVDAGDTDTISFAAQQFLPANASATRRFQIMEGPVTFACGGGQLTRQANYAIRAAITDAIVAGGPAPALLATRVAGCAFTYLPGAFERWGLVGLTLTLTLQGETVTLYQEVHVDNSP